MFCKTVVNDGLNSLVHMCLWCRFKRNLTLSVLRISVYTKTTFGALISRRIHLGSKSQTTLVTQLQVRCDNRRISSAWPATHFPFHSGRSVCEQRGIPCEAFDTTFSSGSASKFRGTPSKFALARRKQFKL